MRIRTRFAPSPTGNLHIGNVRTALYAWLFARKQGGEFFLRIEDSDSQRSTENAVDNIISGLNWLKLNWDKGPYFQTNRFLRYNSVIKHMIQSGIAYKCYCSSERLQSLRNTQIKNGEKPKYDGYCRIQQHASTMIHSNNVPSPTIPYVVRFRNPQEGIVRFHDQIRGTISFCNNELDDLIICRADGSPTYNFCVVIDDMDMNITHIIRGEEHISNTPRQINILKALNAVVPVYAHVSMILGSDRKKLSKRYGASGMMQYRDDGFLPEAIINYLVRLGWSYGNQEIFSIDQMKKYFDLNKIGRSASIFNLKKLLWYNHYYINHLPIDHVVSHLSWHMRKNNINVNNGPKLTDMVKLFSKRSYTLKDIVHYCYPFYQDFDIVKDKVAQSYLHDTDTTVLILLRKELINITAWNPEIIQFVIINVMNELNIDMHQIGILLRTVLIGIHQSPALSKVIYFIGKSRVLDRIDKAIYLCQFMGQ